MVHGVAKSRSLLIDSHFHFKAVHHYSTLVALRGVRMEMMEAIINLLD